MFENLIKLKYMVSISNRNMAPRGQTSNITTIITKDIPNQEVMAVDVVTVVLLINQNMSGIQKRMLQLTQEKKTVLKALQNQ